MADYIQPDYVEKRLRYFDGQLLKDQDFVDEQKYFIDRQRRHNRFLNVSGIIHGLTLTPATDLVTVAPGAALDKSGRLVVLSDQVIDKDRQAQLGAYRDTTVDLVISYKEDPDPPIGEAPRFREKPQLTVVSSGSQPDGAIALARLTIDKNGGVTVDTRVRVYAGARFPYDGGGPELRAGGIGRLDVTGDFSVSGKVGIGATTEPAEMLQVKGGKIQLDGNQQIKFTDEDTSGTLLKIQLWSGYGLGLNDDTLFYAGGKHSWRDVNGVTERMALTTEEGGGLTVLGTGTSSFAGNVGIGTTDPGPFRLKVDGTLNVTGASTFTGNIVTTGLRLISVDADPSSAYLDVTTKVDERGLVGYQFRPAGREGLIITTLTGNVGIGTEDPEPFRLKVEGTLNVTGASTFTGNVGIGAPLAGGVGLEPWAPLNINLSTEATNTVNTELISRWTRPRKGGVKFGNTFDILLGSYGTSDQSQTRVDFKLADRNEVPGNTVMTLQANGNVGIGTTDPGTDRLKVEGTLNVTGMIKGAMFGARKGYANKVKTPPSDQLLLDPAVEALSDGFVVAILELVQQDAMCWIEGVLIQGSLIEVAATASINAVANQDYPIWTNSFTMPVRRGEKWSVRFRCAPPHAAVQTYTIYWIPLGA